MTTLRDIANRSGLSVPTVSRILNPNSITQIRPRDRNIKLVREIADELDYSPNAAARSLASNRTGNIGLFFDFRRSFFIGVTFWSIRYRLPH